MDNLIEETRKLSNALKVWEFGSILQLFSKYAQRDPAERRQLVLEEYFRSLPSKDNATCQVEVDIIREIFPQFERSYILKLIDTVGNEDNSIRIVIKFLLRKTSMVRKRSNNEITTEVPVKIAKLSEASNGGVAWNEPSTSKAQYLSPPAEWNQPSTSKAHNSSIVVEAITPSVSNAANAYTLKEESRLTSLPITTERDKVVEWLGVTEEPLEVESNGTVPRNDSEAPTFNIYKHLHDMFPTVLTKYIKAVCRVLKVSKHDQPPEHIMKLIIATLEQKYISDSLENDSVLNLEVVASSSAPFLSEPSSSEIIAQAMPQLQEKKEIPKICTGRTTNSFENNEVIVLDEFTSKEKDLETILTELQDIAYKEDKCTEAEDDDSELVYPLMEIFPEACPNFIRQLCKGKQNTPEVLDSLISEILEVDYPKRSKEQSPPRKLDATEQLEIMKSILVDADPDYLQMHCDRLIDDPDKLKEFISQAVERRNYPTLKDFLRKQQISAQQNQYTTEFSIEKFLEVIPNPFQYFNDKNRKTNKLDYLSQHYALCYLRNKFCYISLRSIRDCFVKNEENFLATCKELDSFSQFQKMKTKRARSVMPKVIQNIPLLQEIAFYDHQNEIELFLKKRKLEEDLERAQAKTLGLLLTCSCCYDDEIMIKDSSHCEAGCIFCKDCVRKGAEVAFGDGKLDFPCLGACNSHFSLQVLQAVLTPKMFSLIALKKQVEEVKAAGIEDLETCPFCDFVTIPARDDKLFRCLNPQCMKESCRSCKEPSHVPLRCDEVEKDEDVKARTYIENKMTEALLRTCYKCGMKFIKADGCNKMTCSCGALMCYVCGQPVKDYNHFNGNGGDKINLCPLYSDTNKLHKQAILKGAKAAKSEIGIDNKNKKLKIDPTLDIQQHYKPDPKQIVPPAAVNPFLVLNHEEIVLQRRALQMFQHNRRHRN